MCEQFVLVGHAGEIVADHLVCPQRRLAARPKTDQHTGDNRQICLNLDAHRVLAEQVSATEDVFEKAEESLSVPIIIPPKLTL